MEDVSKEKWTNIGINGAFVHRVGEGEKPFYSVGIPNGVTIGGGHTDLSGCRFTLPVGNVKPSQYEANKVVLSFPPEWAISVERGIKQGDEWTNETVATIRPELLKDALYSANRKYTAEMREEREAAKVDTAPTLAEEAHDMRDASVELRGGNQALEVAR